MTDSPRRGVSAGALWQAGCKDCQAERRAAVSRAARGTGNTSKRPDRSNAGSTTFEYSAEWVDRMLDRGNSRSDRCERHRQAHRKAIQAIAVPYVSLQVIGEVLDPNHPSGPLGGLGPVPVLHRRTAHDVDLNRFEFGMGDTEIVQLLDGLQTHQVAVVEAGTGTGKSTFMPFRLMKPPAGSLSLTKFGPIVVTEPRLAAAKGVARFVGEELCFGHDSRRCSAHIGPGFSVGYQVKGERVWDSACELIYVTDGTMINWLRDGQLARIGAVIVDEAHERSENIDIILAQLRERVHQHKHLRVIITSATLDKNFFVEYFGGPVKVFHLSVPATKSFGYGVPLFPDLKLSEDIIRQGLSINASDGAACQFSGWTERGPEQGDYAAEDLHETTRHLSTLRCVDPVSPDEWRDAMPAAVAKQVLAIARGTEWGDILAFLPTSATIESAVDAIKGDLKQVGLLPKFDVYPLLSTIDKTTADKATGARQRGDKRKIVVSSNLAETSLTVKGVRYVVDSGLICQPEWDPDIASGSYPTKPHSQSGVRQRWGRVGRDAPGWVFPLYSTEQFFQLPKNTPPGSAQTNLETFYLKLMAAGVDVEAAVLPTNFRHDAVAYDADALEVIRTFEHECRRAANALRLAGAVDAEGHLTEYGREIERFPGEGSGALAMMLAEQLACVHEVALAIEVLGGSRLIGRDQAILGIDSAWPIAWRVEALQRHRALAYGCCDDLDLLLRVYNRWQSVPNPSDWCAQWWINERALQEGWSDAMKAVRALSAAMKGEADRIAMPELADRARAILTRAMVGIRYERIEGSDFRTVDTTSVEPQVAQMGRGALIDPGPRVLAFGRFRVPARDDGPSRVFISHLVQFCDWAVASTEAGSGLDLVLRCAEHATHAQSRDALASVRDAIPVGAVVSFNLGAVEDGVYSLSSLRIIAPSQPRPVSIGAGDPDDDRAGFDRDWDPIGRITAEIPEEELREQIVDSRELENNDRELQSPVKPEPATTDREVSSDTTPMLKGAKAAWASAPLALSGQGRIVAYDVATDGGVVLAIEPLALECRDAYTNTDVELGQEVSVVACGVVRHNEREYVQFARSDARGYFFIDALDAALGNYDRSFSARVAPGRSFAAVVVPDEQDTVTITVLPGLHRSLEKQPAETITVNGEPTTFYPATIVEGPNNWGKVIVALDGIGDSSHQGSQFQVNQREFRGPLGGQIVPGQQILLALGPDSGRSRGELDVNEVEAALALVERQPQIFRLDKGRATVRAANVPLSVIKQLAAAKTAKRWSKAVWRFYEESLRLSVKMVRAKPIRREAPSAPALLSLIRERRKEVQDRYGLSVRLNKDGLSVEDYDARVVNESVAKLEGLSALPRVVARLPANTAGRVIGTGGSNRKRLEALPGVSWVWVEGDTVGIIADSPTALESALRDIRGSVESATGELRVPAGKNGYLIGTKGATIERLRSSTGCRAANPDKGSLWVIEGPTASAVQDFIGQATAIVGGSGSVTSTKQLAVVEDTRQAVRGSARAAASPLSVPKQSSGSKSAPAAKRATPKTTPSQRAEQKAEKPSSGCFVATACYGDSEHPDVVTLREWRDRRLRQTKTGRRFIAAYYRLSPPIARFLAGKRVLVTLGRIALGPIVRFARAR